MAYSLLGERPHRAAWPIRTLSTLVGQFVHLAAAYRRRQMLETLLELEDHRLWDLGVTRNDLIEALKTPDYDIQWARERRRAISVWPPR
ncbi:MAG TPA: DUF1127 domain-containing protein [Devosia sp.]|jgi:uncharacterized protein YjiS (DUF1127 family)|nr:DUF1127 domain-containing protein [Devosia sp.]